MASQIHMLIPNQTTIKCRILCTQSGKWLVIFLFTRSGAKYKFPLIQSYTYSGHSLDDLYVEHIKDLKLYPFRNTGANITVNIK